MRISEPHKETIPIYQVDAFTDEAFKGNPAAVCLLEEELAADLMQKIAAEMNLSETAFLYSLEDKTAKECKHFSLRWFTPAVEVPLCGHATLATAAVLFNEVRVMSDHLTFETKSDALIAVREKKGIRLDFPANAPKPTDPPIKLLEAMDISKFEDVQFDKGLKILLVQLYDEETVRNLDPNSEDMRAIPGYENILGVIVTSRSKEYDFISRFFCPWVGIKEDPVTGAAHTVLTPYWSKILNKEEMSAYQASARGGKLTVRLQGDRVDIIGNAVIVLRGSLVI